MKEKMRKQKIQVVVGVVLAAFVLCVLPQHKAAAAAAGIQQISLGGNCSAVLKTDGSLWMWGSNSNGELGNGSTKSSSTPIKVLTGVKEVCLGAFHSAAVKKDGSLWLWGRNNYGQLGNGKSGEKEYSSKPVKVMTGVQSVSLKEYHSAAVKKDGSLWLWGYNSSGQLGNGSTANSSKPVKVMTGVESVSLGYDYSAAVKKDGSLWMWGSLQGNGSTENSSSPVKVMTGVQSVSLGYDHSAVVKKDGSLWMWGWNNYGQLGNGSTQDSNEPMKVLTGVKEVCLGAFHSAVVKKDGSLWMWGNNRFGELGNGKDGETEYSNVPVKIMTGVKAASLGIDLSAALKKDGSLWRWGRGPLGNGDGESSNKPVKITLSDSTAAKINITECKITLSKKQYTYTGKAIKPLPTVKYNGKILKNKTDYTLTYKDNKKRGTATIVIKGKGSYTGQSQIKFTIKK